MSLITRLLSLRGCRFCLFSTSSEIMAWLFSFSLFTFIFVVVVVVVELSLHLWKEDYLMMVDGLSDVFLDSICRSFTEYFCVYVDEENWSVILLLCSIFVWFEYQDDSARRK